MNWMKRAVLAAAMFGIATVSNAQSQGYSGFQFVEAVRAGDNAKAVDLLKDTPTVINARDGKGETALYVAVSGRDATWTRYLLQEGADTGLGNREGDTPLIAAARIGFMDAAEWLLASGAKVDAANKMGETALIVAVQNRRGPLVRLLLDKGANPDKTDSASGRSARDYAKLDTRSRDILKLIEAKKPKL